MFTCGRRTYGPEGQDTWRADDCCSYCGSLNPEILLERLEREDVELTPTDKNYKVYVENKDGETFKQAYRKGCDMGKEGSVCTGPRDCVHWVVEDRQGTKFYFQHFTREQQEQFIRLYNERKMHLTHPGRFYVPPFFMKFGPASGD